MRSYLALLRQIMEKGEDRPYRNGPARTLFGELSFHHDLKHGFPALTTKKLAFKSMAAELLFFLSGSSDVKVAQEYGTKIWDANAYAPYWLEKAQFPGDLGRIYGVQWRHWRNSEGDEIDQIAKVVEEIKAVKEDFNHPASRRLIVTAWNPAELQLMALPPCHMIYQFDVSMDGRLSVDMFQRSADFFLGVPFNIASYALLLCMVAQVTGLEPGAVTISFGNAHIYHNHFDAVNEQLKREPGLLPELYLNPKNDLFDYKLSDVSLTGYHPQSTIRGDMAV